MSTTKVFEDNRTIVYERKDTTPILGGSKDYKAVDKNTGAEAIGKSVGEALNNLEQGRGR